MHQKIAEKILSRNAKDVLDIACGPGDFLFYLSNLAPNVNLTGTDIAPGMVKYANQKVFGKAKILESDGDKQPFSENSFDAITIMMAFHHFPDKLKALQKIKKLLRQNGVLITADVVAKTEFQKKLWNFLEKVISVMIFAVGLVVNGLIFGLNTIGINRIVTPTEYFIFLPAGAILGSIGMQFIKRKT